MSRFYPAITADSLTPIRAVRGLIAQDPEYLAGSPYDQSTKDFLAEICGVKTLAAPLLVLETSEDLERELIQNYSDIKALEREIKNVDASEKVQWVKAIVSILDKLISLRERNLNMKNMAEFQRTVISIMDEICEPDQRTQISERLQKFL